MTAPDLDAMRARDRLAVARLGNPDRDPLLRAEMDRRALLAEVERLRGSFVGRAAESMELERDAEYTQHRLSYERAERLEAQVRAVREAFENLPLILSAVLRDRAWNPDGRGGEVHFIPSRPGRGKSGCPGDNVTAWIDKVRAALDGTLTNGDDR